MNYHEPHQMEGLSPSYLQHKEESDQIIHEIRETFAINKTYHDGLSEAQTMIGERDLVIVRLEQENQELRNALFMERSLSRG